MVAMVEPGDPIICETPMYAGVLPAMQHVRAECIGE